MDHDGPARESWLAFVERRIRADPDFSDPAVRADACAVVHEIVDRFITPTLDVLTPWPERGALPGGHGYNLEAWLQWDAEFTIDADYEYRETFAASRDPPGPAIVALLARHGLQLKSPDDVARFHRAWVGRRASGCASGRLAGLRAGVDHRRETPQWQADFRALAPLLDRELDAGLADHLVMTLFRLSRRAAEQLLARPYAGYVRALIEWEAAADPLSD